MKQLLIAATISLVFPVTVFAHGGGLDGSGGHNCNVGSCAGSYHYHHGGDKTVEYSYPEGQSPNPSPAPAPAPEPTPTITTKTETKKEVIKYETIEQEDEDLPKGERKLIQEGKNGERTITYKVTYTDGVETSRKESSNTVTKEPTNEVYSVGTKEPEQEEVAAISTNEEPEEMSDGAALATLGVMGGGGYYAYKKIKGRKKIA